MNLNLWIDRLILHELNVPRSHQLQVQEALSAELTRLLTEQGVPDGWQFDIAVPRLSIQIPVIPKPNPTQLGQQIAHSMYTQLQAQRLPTASSSKPIAPALGD